MGTSERTRPTRPPSACSTSPSWKLQTQFEQLKVVIANASDRNAPTSARCRRRSRTSERALGGYANFNDSDMKPATPVSPQKFKLAALSMRSFALHSR